MEPPSIPAVTGGNKDSKHLHVLAVFHFVSAGLALLNTAYLAVVIAALKLSPGLIHHTALQPGNEISPAELATLTALLDLGVWFVAIAIISTLVYGTLNVVAAFDMLKRRRRTLSMTTAALNCLSVPVGTTLGIFTLIVLSRDSVCQLYANAANHSETPP